MVRKKRKSILYDGCYAHVFSRSIEKRYIFKKEKDFKLFKVLLLEAKREYGFKIFHYCLMHSHFHLAVGIGELEAFSLGMKWLKCQFTKDYNKLRKRWGTVWQGRYKSLVIEDEDYLRACGLYIENNPVEAGIVSRANDWEYSSSGFWEEGKKDELVDCYEWGGAVPTIESDRKTFFERGTGIGSALFKIHLQEDLSESASVPLNGV